MRPKTGGKDNEKIMTREAAKRGFAETRRNDDFIFFKKRGSVRPAE